MTMILLKVEDAAVMSTPAENAAPQAAETR
jgi:hypothetical protein